MVIKQSTLEQKWYYRIAKVFFLVLPVAVAIAVVLNKKIITLDILWRDPAPFLKENVDFLVYLTLGIIAYYVALRIIWRGFLYIAFGGLERDTVKNNPPVGQQSAGQVAQTTGAQTGQSSQSGAISKEDKKQIGFYLFILVIIAIIYYSYFIWKPANIIIDDDGGGGGDACVPTGCGSQWYCYGAYYENGVEKRINGCLSKKAEATFPSWSGTCRRCP
ncbi:MAG: hypothetical protein V1856_00595 [Candidatus Liptonbacteria bacterium]